MGGLYTKEILAWIPSCPIFLLCGLPTGSFLRTTSANCCLSSAHKAAWGEGLGRWSPEQISCWGRWGCRQQWSCESEADHITEVTLWMTGKIVEGSIWKWVRNSLGSCVLRGPGADKGSKVRVPSSSSLWYNSLRDCVYSPWSLVVPFYTLNHLVWLLETKTDFIILKNRFPFAWPKRSHSANPSGVPGACCAWRAEP